MAATLPVAQSRIVARLATGDLIDATVAEINALLGVGGGDVVGPASSTDNALARFDLATGKLIQNSLVLLDDTGNLTGIAELTTSGVVNVGDPGFEASGVNIGGVVYDSIFKANDIGGAQPAQSVIHRHSTTLQAALIGTRSKTDDDTHAALANGDSAFSIFGAYWTGTHYDFCTEILYQASASGTISPTSSPGTIVLKTTPDGSNLPVAVLTLDEDKSATFTGNIAVVGTVDGRDIATDGAKLDGIEALADITDTANVTAAGALMDSEVDADIKTLVLPASTTISTFGASLVDDLAAVNARTTLGLIIGTDVQAWSAVLDATTASFLTADETKLDALTLLTTKGDLTVFTTVETRLPAGTDTHILTLDSAQPSGMKWAALAASATQSFTGSITRAGDGATGTVATTGVGFQPDFIFFMSAQAGVVSMTIGFYDGSTNYGLAVNAVTPNWTTTRSFVVDFPTSGEQKATVSALGSDGFTLSWTKVSSPPATNIDIKYWAMKF